MNQFYITDFFKGQLKPYLKKHKDLLKSLIVALKRFDLDQLISLGEDLYKMRMSSPSLNKGKSGSFRVIIFIDHALNLIVPVTIYAKNRFSNLTKQELKRCLRRTIDELESLP